jgi:hypothetical protein
MPADAERAMPDETAAEVPAPELPPAAEPKAALRDHRMFYLFLKQANRLVATAAAATPLHPELPLGVTEWFTLRTVAETENATPGRLAGVLHTTAPSVKELLAVLLGLGLVEAEGRAHRLTPAGVAALDVLDAAMDRIFAGAQLTTHLTGRVRNLTDALLAERRAEAAESPAEAPVPPEEPPADEVPADEPPADELPAEPASEET